LFIRIVFFVGWIFVCLGESNRRPFDFSEGESELVSGFNVEYYGGVFSLVFICEYGIIIFICFISVFVLGRCRFVFKVVFVCFFMFGFVALILVIDTTI
jgi:NADH-ubiquinone oxidoreductase chain 1